MAGESENRKGRGQLTGESGYRWFDQVTEDGWEHDVWLMARRMALLYHYLTQAIVERLGDEEGKELVEDAVWKYGQHCGSAVREAVLARGMEPTPQNFAAVADLPSRGWRSGPCRAADGREFKGTTLCPLAKTWQAVGTGRELARLYCRVDQAKFAAYYGGEYVCVHAHNVLDGDSCCEIVVRPNLERKA